mmetsp:Transcript_5097/g.12215  ORF Transcript_5097/g.12215 Transcript_5097/m.12215 type:complete len:607 (-) Transcript_5097:75-1895(-)
MLMPLSFRPLWEETAPLPAFMNVSATEMLGSRPAMELEKSDTSRFGEVLVDNGCMSRVVLSPSSHAALLVDFCSVLAILWDLISLPLVVFDFHDTPMASLVNMITSIFWACELPIPFFLGYYRADAKVELRSKHIAQRYLKSWFIPHLILVLTDLSLLTMDAGDSSAVNVLRIHRIRGIANLARVARLIRVASVLERVEDLTSYVLSEMVHAYLSVFGMVTVTAFVCHAVACLWFAIGTQWSPPPNLATELGIKEETFLYQYTLCFSYVWAQFTPAPPPHRMHPFNALEGFFTIGLRCFGLVLFSSFVGSVTATMTQARRRAEERHLQNTQLHQYFSENSITLVRSVSIMRFIQRKMRRRTRLMEKQVTLLHRLPYTMLSELRLEVYGPLLSCHPLFAYFATKHGPTLQQVCATALSERLLEVGDELLHYGAEAESMYFVRKSIRADTDSAIVVHFYFGVPEAGNLKRGPDAVLEEGGWIGEAALWLANYLPDEHAHHNNATGFHHWRHYGFARAVRTCALLEVNSNKFRRIVLEHASALADLRLYAKEFYSMVPEYVHRFNMVGVWGESEEMVRNVYALTMSSSKVLTQSNGFTSVLRRLASSTL